MPEFICEECGRREFHENEDTLKMMVKIHENFCRKREGENHSFMHRDDEHDYPWMLKGQMTKKTFLYSNEILKLKLRN